MTARSGDHAAERLVRLADRLRRDGITLLDQSAFDGAEVLVAVLEGDITVGGSNGAPSQVRVVLALHSTVA